MDEFLDINDPPVVELTPFLGLPLPVQGNPLHYDLGSIRSAFAALDQAIQDAAPADDLAATMATVAHLVTGAPVNLDSLQKLAQAIGNDPAFSATLAGQIASIQSALAGKMPNQPATSTTLGGIKAGSGLSIGADGLLSVVGSGSGAGVPAFNEQVLTPTSNGQTSFTIPGGYSPGTIEVFLNGVLLYGNGNDYTASNGTAVVLTAGISTADALLVRRWTTATNLPFSTLVDKPTTLAGYGITDGAAKATTLAGYGIADGVKRLAPQHVAAAFTAQDGGVYLCDMSPGPYTATMPANPQPGCIVTFIDMVNKFDVSPLTIDRNGKPFYFSAENYVLDQKGQGRTFIYYNQDLGWVIYA